MKKTDFYKKGFQDVRRREIVAWGACFSWQKKAYKKGYLAGSLYFKAEALLEGFNTPQDYRKHLTMSMIK